MKYVLSLLVLAGACKTDEQPKPAPAKLEVAPSPKPAPAPPPAEPPPPEPTRSQQALEKRGAVFSKVAVTAKKNQGNCVKLAEAAAALGDEVRGVAALRGDLTREDAETDLSGSNRALQAWLELSVDCKDASKLEPVTNALIAESKR